MKIRIKKVLLSASILLLGICLLSGCQSVGNASIQQDDSKQEASTSTDRAERKIVQTVQSQLSLKEDYDVVEDFKNSPSVDVVVEGTVVATKDIYIEGGAERVLTVKPKEVYESDVSSTITVHEDGGVVPFREVVKDFEDKFPNPQYSKEELDGYVDFVVMEAPHSEAGDQVILYLFKDPNKGVYRIVSSLHGRFTKTEEASETYKRPFSKEGTSKKFEEKITKKQFKKFAVRDFGAKKIRGK